MFSAPKQRNADDEKRTIKQGKIPKDWKDKPNKLAQKDRDARWTVMQKEALAQEPSQVERIVVLAGAGAETTITT